MFEKLIEALNNLKSSIGQNGDIQGDWRSNADPVLLNIYDQFAGMPMLANADSINGQTGDFSNILPSLQAAIESGDYRQMYGLLSGYGYKFSPDQTAWFNDMLSKQGVNEANEYTAGREDTALIRQAEQLANLGLGTSNVISMGGAGSSASAVPSVDHNNVTAASQRFTQKMAMTRQMISLVGALAGAGIGGSAMALSRRAAARSAEETAITVQHMKNKMANRTRYRKFVDAAGHSRGGFYDYYDEGSYFEDM